MLFPARTCDFTEGEILLFDKPYGWTSFDLVGKVRFLISRKLNIKKIKVGHAGTLDPLATGLMILCTGKATKQVESLQLFEKEYIATLKFGATTPSFDMETPEDTRSDTEPVTLDTVAAALLNFTGPIQQVPPAFSAIKIDGKRAYKHARKGIEPELLPRRVVIHEIELLSFDKPYAEIRVVCSKGTYIRALARDMGVFLGCGAYLTGLRRTRIGHYSIENALRFEEFQEVMK